MTRTSDVPTGDTIAQHLQGRKEGDSLLDVANALTDAHAHRPGLFQQDLAAVNQKLHDQGILPGFDIVGVRGQDLVTKNTSLGVTEIFDSTNLNNHHADVTGSTAMINGRKATIGADGSGQLIVKKGDNNWAISRDVLKSQGIESPTDTQIANYEKELVKANGKGSLAMIYAGETIKLPPSMKGGANTEFTDDRANGAEQKAKDQITEETDAAKAAMAKTNWTLGSGFNVSKSEIMNDLNRSDLTDQERKGFEFLRDNFDQMKDVGKGFLGADGKIWEGGLQQWKDNALRAAELDSFQARKDG